MPFQVRAKLVAWLGDPVKYPCHHMYEIGDEIIYDGESLIGSVCPDMFKELGRLMNEVHNAGPRYVETGYYLPFWYAPCSKANPEKAKYDGNGFDNVLETIIEPKYHLRTMQDPNSFNWPPCHERIVAKQVSMFCPDIRTSGLFTFEAFDLSVKGQDKPHGRRQMTIMDRVWKQPDHSYRIERIGEDLYDDFERMEIYPPVVPEYVRGLIDEMRLLDYAVIEDEGDMMQGKITITQKGADCVARFKASLTPEEVEALKL